VAYRVLCAENKAQRDKMEALEHQVTELKAKLKEKEEPQKATGDGRNRIFKLMKK
jgi:predicted RNase H-like nuclease (RuvC/YqgF family)